MRIPAKSCQNKTTKAKEKSLTLNSREEGKHFICVLLSATQRVCVCVVVEVQILVVWLGVCRADGLGWLLQWGDFQKCSW